MKRQLAAYAGTMIVMVGLDSLWLGIIAKPLYLQGIGHLMADKPNVPVAVLFYALFLACAVVVVLPITMVSLLLLRLVPAFRRFHNKLVDRVVS